MKTYHLIALICIFTSCTLVYFEEPQPAGKKSLDEFPGKLHGLYMPAKEDGTSLRINDTEILFLFADKNEIKLLLNKNLIVKKYKGEYYVNIKDQDNQYWGLYLLSLKGKKLIMKTSALNDDNLMRFHRITNITGYHSKEKGVHEYILNPTLSQLKELIREGLFIEADTLIKK